MKKQLQKGFTLIELMIVVAIIGILASIALPAYQDYMTRSQAAESVVLLNGARTSLEDYAAQNGTFPAGAEDVSDLETLGINGVGTYGTLGEPVKDTTNADAGTIVYTFSGAVSAQITGKKVTYTRATGGGWDCTSDLALKFQPKGCGL